MTDATSDVATAEAEAPKGFLGRLLARKKLVIIIAVLLFLLAAGGGLWMAMGTRGVTALVGVKPAAKAQAHAPAGVAGGDAQGAAQPTETEILPFKDIVVNISGSTATGATTTRFLKIDLDMVYAASAANKALMEKKQPYLRDAIVGYLRQLSEDDLRGTDGLLLLKAELLKRARAVVGSDAPQEFLVGDLVMQ
ncbi:flagellar basal body-associated FliL family protein [Solirhodobacter olei]|uniref:flagellar basal body-associated FliL family protein n=1 Tax=Solirhodobacter olei TaxID=2493082 RepID=UPI000FD81494|nr:flagellar basal body-associated FliL family protein [Solirhodobacter olei]